MVRTLVKLGGAALCIGAGVFLWAYVSRLGVPGDKTVEALYRAQHPGRTVKGIQAGEAELDTVRYHIRYEDTGTSKSGEDVWVFENQEDEWVVLSRNSVREE